MATQALAPRDDDLVQDIVRRIVATAQPEKVILFGSRRAERPGPTAILTFW